MIPWKTMQSYSIIIERILLQEMGIKLFFSDTKCLMTIESLPREIRSPKQCWLLPKQVILWSIVPFPLTFVPSLAEASCALGFELPYYQRQWKEGELKQKQHNSKVTSLYIPFSLPKWNSLFHVNTINPSIRSMELCLTFTFL